MRTLTLTACALAALLAACSPAAEEPATAPAPTPATDAPPPVAAPQTPAAPTAAISLDAEGLRLVNRQTGSTSLIAFGQPQAQVIETLARAQGGAPRDQGVNGECGAGPLAYSTWPDGLTLWFQNDAFVGWAANMAGPSTMNGIAVGSTRAQLDDSGTVVDYQETSLGTEFSAGEIFGILDGPQGAVTNLWGGTSCNFR